jgi:SAM-dependent methyltransferase
MDPKTLPTARRPNNLGHDIVADFSDIISIAGAKCLCIGYDEAQLTQLVLKYNPRDVTLLTLWKGHKDIIFQNYHVHVGDISKKTPFEDSEFDFVLTFSVLEHVNELENAFIEIRRVLKPCGYFCSLFGPVWSSPYGHHLYASPGNPSFDFSQWQMPSHVHLLCTPEEITQYYRALGARKDECATVIHWLFETDIINRLFYEDYLALVWECFYYVASINMYSRIDSGLITILRSRFKKYKDFSTYGSRILLKNMKDG